MNISYLLFSHNETDTLQKLLSVVSQAKDDIDEIIISDDYSTNLKTQQIINSFAKNAKLIQYKLDDGYSNKKNKALQHCSGNYIFAIDADERPTETLLINIKDIVKANPGIESFWISRINDFIGVTQKHASQWGWKLTPSTSIIHEKLIDTESDEYKLLKTNGYILEETKIG
jgi:glycosyltransferase involved in cell wall biosynthesis